MMALRRLFVGCMCTLLLVGFSLVELERRCIEQILDANRRGPGSGPALNVTPTRGHPGPVTEEPVERVLRQDWSQRPRLAGVGTRISGPERIGTEDDERTRHQSTSHPSSIILTISSFVTRRAVPHAPYGRNMLTLGP